ncbi:hypothetical protein ABIB68_002470 [Bradyrhizobium sp. F1.2.2]
MISQPEADLVQGFEESDVRKEKTRPGGQPDGSSHMGAWGGWALAPDMTYGEG